MQCVDVTLLRLARGRWLRALEIENAVSFPLIGLSPEDVRVPTQIGLRQIVVNAALPVGHATPSSLLADVPLRRVRRSAPRLRDRRVGHVSSRPRSGRSRFEEVVSNTSRKGMVCRVEIVINGKRSTPRGLRRASGVAGGRSSALPRRLLVVTHYAPSRVRLSSPEALLTRRLDKNRPSALQPPFELRGRAVRFSARRRASVIGVSVMMPARRGQLVSRVSTL